MSDKKSYFLAGVALVILTILVILGGVFNSVDLLFNVMLTVIGVFAGILTSSYFARKSELQNLGKYGLAGYRLSVRIYDSMIETQWLIDKAKEDMKENTLSPETFTLILNSIAEKLKVIQRMSLAANDNWRDVLPEEQAKELREREKRIALVKPISQEREVRMTEEIIPLKGREGSTT